MKSLFRRTAKDPVVAALDGAAALESDGRALAAIDVLSEANRGHRAGALETRLVETRHRAFHELGGNGHAQSPGEVVNPGTAPEDDGMPAIAARELTAARIAGALASKGALIVRGLVNPARVGTLVDGIDRAFDGRDAAADGATRDQTGPWYAEFAPEGDGAGAVAIGRGFIAKSDSGVWTADSPRVMFDLLESFE
jgi:hypothetical protein